MTRFLVAFLLLLFCNVVYASDQRDPLITIKFNKENMQYDSLLTDIIAKAAGDDNETHFEIQSIAPKEGQSDSVHTLDHVFHIHGLLSAMDIPKRNIDTHIQSDDVKFGNVKIFASK